MSVSKKNKSTTEPSPINLIRLPKPLSRPRRPSRAAQRSRVKVYIDTSLALDYYLATGREWPEGHFIDPRSDYEKAEQALWEEFLKDNKRLARATRLREIVSWDYSLEARLVISPLVLFEMQEWIAADTIKRGLLTVTQPKALQSLLVKEIGEFAKRLWDSGSEKSEGCRRDWAYALFHSPIGEGLVGIQIEDVPGLTIGKRTFAKVLPIAVFQIGLADIIHILAAKRLGSHTSRRPILALIKEPGS
jgi:hypothetical protein